MRSHTIYAAVGICLALGAGGAGAAACSSSSPSSNNQPPGSSPDGSTPNGSGVGCSLAISFNPMYSASDGMHTFQIPAVVNAMGSVAWTASDMNAVQFQPNADLTGNGYTGTTITVLSAPSQPVMITAQSGSSCGTAVLKITSATATDWQIGNARYNNGASLHLPMFGGDAGMPMMFQADAGSYLETADGGPACTSCHGPTATNGFLNDVAHTPEQTGGFSDDDLVNIIVHGVVPDGGYFDPNIVSMRTWHSFHQWSDITPDQQKGIVVYLRSLTPSAQKGTINLGGFGMDGGAGGGSAGEGGGPATDGTTD